MNRKIKLYYMRDNHTFRKLARKTAIKDALEEFDRGYSSGMMCAFINDKHYSEICHANRNREEFEQEAKKWLRLLFSAKESHVLYDLTVS